jgi:hypothetical protein
MLKNNHFKNLEHNEPIPKWYLFGENLSQGIALNILTLREEGRILLNKMLLNAMKMRIMQKPCNLQLYIRQDIKITKVSSLFFSKH